MDLHYITITITYITIITILTIALASLNLDRLITSPLGAQALMSTHSKLCDACCYVHTYRSYFCACAELIRLVLHVTWIYITSLLHHYVFWILHEVLDRCMMVRMVIGASLSEPHTSDTTYFRCVRLYIYLCVRRCPPKPPTHAHMDVVLILAHLCAVCSMSSHFNEGYTMLKLEINHSRRARYV